MFKKVRKTVEMIEKMQLSQQTNMEHDEDIEMSNPKSKVFCKKNSVDDMFREIPTSKLIKTEPEDIISRTKIKKPRFDKEEEDEIGKNMPLKNRTSPS